MPDMAEAVLECPLAMRPFSRHQFQRSRPCHCGLRGRPADVKARFLAVRRELELEITGVQDMLEADPSIAQELGVYGQSIFDAIARLGGVINGEMRREETSAVQDAVDRSFLIRRPEPVPIDGQPHAAWRCLSAQTAISSNRSGREKV
jgi:hypothetical protein